jgi:hypothetical protein
MYKKASTKKILSYFILQYAGNILTGYFCASPLFSEASAILCLSVIERSDERRTESGLIGKTQK